MYIWQICINGTCYIGRTWDEFIEVCNTISYILELSEEKIFVFYVHNLSYEFQFIRDYFEWSSVFATDTRKPLYALTSLGIEFRCSYMLSGYSLATVGKNLTKYKVQKKEGDLDYKLIRTPETPLTEKELGYCINDVLVIVAFIQEEIEKNGDITKIPLTKTGYVRKYCRNACLYKDKNHKKEVDYHINYRKYIKNLSVTTDEYMMLKRAFQGGFTHASALYVNEVIENVSSHDETSAYPYTMIAEKFPASKGQKVIPKDDNEFKNYLLKYCCMMDITFFNIEDVFFYDNYISASKCWKLINPVVNNGRVVSADCLSITITEQDFFIICKTYKYEYFGIGDMYIYRKAYLPTVFVESILQLYADKTKLKGVQGMETEYLNTKGMLNSCYGMAVTDMIQNSTMYIDGQWTTYTEDINKQIEDANNSYKRFLFYPWGVWVTAYARRNLWSAIMELKEDYIYSDTDSVKYVNMEKHKGYFDFYNENVQNKLHKCMQWHQLPDELWKPKSVKGEEKILGVWDYEGTYTRFKTLGAKRYMVQEDDEYSLTVSGLNKKICMPYLIDKYKNPFDAFNDDMYIPPDYTGKQTHTYLDLPADGEVTDYMGNKYQYHMQTGIHLENAEYNLSLSKAFIEFLKERKAK